MKRGFRGTPRPLLPAMLLVATTNPNAGQEHDAVAQSQPSSLTSPVPSTSSPLVQSPPPIPTSIPTPIPTSIPTHTLIPETEPAPFEHTFEEPSPVHQHLSPPQEQAHGPMAMDDLLQVVPQLISRIDSLETDLKQTKLTMGNALVKLVKKVKKLEGLLKKRNVVLSDSEEEEPEAQGRKSQDDPLASLVQGLVTPSMTKVNASGEEQVEDISPNTLEAAKTLSRVASLKPKSIDKGRRYKRRKETKGKKVVSSLVFQEEVDTGAKEVNTAEGVNTGSIKLSTVSEQVSTGSAIPSPDKGQRAGKAPMIIEETPKKSKEQILQEEASLAEAIRLDSLQKEEEAKQIHLDSLLAQRIAEEEELNEQQKKRRAQVQFEAQHYTDEDWDLIRAKIEANAELSKSMLGSDLQGEDFAKKMVDLVNQRKKYFAEERARAKRNKPMTQSQLKTYMMNYLKNQGTWKLSQLKNLSFEEVKEEFDKLVKQQRIESTKKTGKRRKQIARKGLHSDKTDEDESEDSKDDDPISGTNIPINPVPLAIKPPSIATYKIIKQGEKGVYQIVREDGTNIVYGVNGPKDELEKSTMSNKHKDWLVQEQTALGKDFSNPLMADNLPKIVWLSTHHIFQQGFDETFYEAWDRFNDLLRACPHHRFSELHQLDTFYNALNSNDQDSLNSAAGGNFLDKMPRDCLRIIESKSKVRNSGNNLVVAKVSSSSSTPGISPDVAELKDMVKDLLLDKKNHILTPTPVKAVEKSWCNLLCGVAYQGPTIPTTSSSPPKVVERETEPVVAPENASMPNPNPSILYPSRRMDECLALADLSASINLMPLSVWKNLSLSELTPTCITLELADCSITQPIGELTLRVGKEAVTFNLDQLRDTPLIDDMNWRHELTVIEMNWIVIFSSRKSTLSLCLEDDPTSPEVDDSYYDPEGDILLLEAFLNDDPSLPPPTQGNYLPEIQKELKVCEAKTDKSSIDEPPEVELKDLPPHLEYTFLEGDDKLPVIIAKDLSVEEKAALIKVLKSHKRAIAWKLSNIKGINPKFYTHKILMEEDYKPAVQHQRRVNPKIHDVIKKEVEKLLDAILIYPISDSP
ncbi:hypothetical protein Tco_1301909 [Tanacetum coccineum]